VNGEVLTRGNIQIQRLQPESALTRALHARMPCFLKPNLRVAIQKQSTLELPFFPLAFYLLLFSAVRGTDRDSECSNFPVMFC